MRMPGRRAWIVLLLSLVIGVAGYRVGRQAWAAYQYREAEAALGRRDFAAARARLERCVDADGGDRAARLLLARTARRQGDVRAAAEHLDVLQRQGGPAEAVALEQKLRRVQAGALDEIEPLLAFCADRPDVPETPLILEACIEGSLRGLAPAQRQGMLVGAAETSPEVARVRRAVEQWLELRGGPADQAQGLVWRARVRALENDQAGALADLRAALGHAPDHFDARLYLALFRADRAPAEADAELEALHRQAPANNHVRFALAATRRTLGKPDDAARLLDAVLADFPDTVPALLERGQVALELAPPADAEPWLRRAVALAPDDARVNLALATCLRLAGRPADAKAYQDRFQQLDAEHKRKAAQAPPGG
jgi:tetratricopeptide (TPR) repeat protein